MLNRFFYLFFYLCCVNSDCRKWKERCATPGHRLVNSIITLKDKNKGSRIICCHTPILINNSVLHYAVSPVEIGICLEAPTVRRVRLAASLLRPMQAAAAETPSNRFPLGKIHIWLIWKQQFFFKQRWGKTYIHPSPPLKCSRCNSTNKCQQEKN